MNRHHPSFVGRLQVQVRRAPRALIALLVVSILAIGLTQAVEAGFVRSSFQQCSNKNNTLGQCKWIGSNAQDSNSVYIEGMALAQRVYFDGVTNRAAAPQTTHVISWNTQWTKGSRHAYDWLVSYAQAQALSTAIGGFAQTMNYCSDLSTSGQSPTETNNCNAVYPSGNHVSVDVPDDSYVSGQCDPGLCNTQDRINAFESIFGPRSIDVYTNQPVTATLTQQHKACTDVATYANGADSGDQDQCWTLTIVPTNPANPPTIILVQAAGHISAGWDPQNQNGVGWGGQFSAGNISGSPYHFKALKLDGDGGSQDNQLNATAIPVRPTLSTSVSSANVTFPTSFRDNATVVGTNSLGAPQGKVYFYICGPTATPTACNTNTATLLSSNTLTTGANNTSTAQSALFTPTQNVTGYYCFAIGYSRPQSNPPGYDHYSNETQTTTTNECVRVTPAATAVNLARFRGERTEKGKAQLKWQTGTELNILGFNVWRKTGTTGWEKINTDMIAARSVGTIEGGRYKYTDRNAAAGQAQKYKLEIVNVYGSSGWSDIVKVK